MKKTIINCVENIVSKTGTRDPVAICKVLGIQLYYHDLGGKLKGYYLYERRISNIVIDCNLSEIDNKIVLPHEIGHYSLHRNSQRLFKETSLRNLDPTEYEANNFGAELLITDNCAIDLIKEYNSISISAAIIGVPEWFFKCKVNMLREKGYDLPVQYFRSDSLR